MKTFKELKNNKRVIVWAIDGLDGAGKGTVSSHIFKMLGGKENILQVSLPFYESKWGKILKYLLYENDMNLSEKERMAVYALNRIEIVEIIKKITQKALDKNKKSRIIILFNRYPFSSFITTSYYLLKDKYKDSTNEDIVEIVERKKVELDVKKRVKFIIDLENYFFETFGTDTKIYIPAIDPKVSINRLLNDSKRIGADMYEDLKVQLIGSYIYEEAQKYYKNLKLFPQNHRTPSVIAKEALDFFEYQPVDNENLGINLDLNNYFSGTMSRNTKVEINKIFKDYPNIKKLESLKL